MIHCSFAFLNRRNLHSAVRIVMAEYTNYGRTSEGPHDYIEILDVVGQERGTRDPSQETDSDYAIPLRYIKYLFLCLGFSDYVQPS